MIEDDMPKLADATKLVATVTPSNDYLYLMIFTLRVLFIKKYLWYLCLQHLHESLITLVIHYWETMLKHEGPCYTILSFLQMG